MREQKKTRNQERRDSFEEIYIRTYHKTYDHIRLLAADHKRAKKLLILTYAELYSNMGEIFGKDNVSDWLKEKADDIAELKMGVSPEQVRASRLKEKTQINDMSRNGIDETSLFLEIEDYLKLDENQESNREISKIWIVIKNIFACALLSVAVSALVFGADKIKKQIAILKAPFLESLSEEDDSEDPKNQKKHIKIANKIVYLSDIGQVLYSVPLEQTEWASEDPENPEIQASKDGWVYYLPCPERKGSVLSNVSPDLFHTLYRIENGKDEIEIVSREVDDYYINEDNIYIETFDRIQVIDYSEEFEKMIPGIYVHMENCEFYLRDMLGRTLKREADGNIHYGDRIFQMDSDRIADVVQVEQKKENSVYELKEENEGQKVIYKISGDTEEVFLKEETTIDSFCIAGDWLYYSAYIRKGGSGAHYSKIFRKSLVEDKKREQVHDEFTGRIQKMYYCQDDNQIYGNYIPRNWENNYGVIVAITANGQMAYLDDTEQRSMKETTGNDTLEFVMMRDNKVYCYWKDYQWEKEKEPLLLWKDVMTISNGKRVRIKD